MTPDELYKSVLDRLDARPYITETLICQRYRVLESQARDVIKGNNILDAQERN